MPNAPTRTTIGWAPQVDDDPTEQQQTPPPNPQAQQHMAYARTMYAEQSQPLAQPAPYLPGVSQPHAAQRAFPQGTSQPAYPQQTYAQPEAYPQPSYPAPYPQQPYPSAPPQDAYGYQQQPLPYYAPPQNQARVDLVAVTPPPASEHKPLRDQANATVGVSERLRFIRLTYLHLLLAILAFAGLEYLLMTNPFLVQKVSIPFVTFALGGRWNWGVVLAVFMAVSWVADYWAGHSKSRAMQYAGLLFYVIAEAVIFVPLLAIVAVKTQAILARGGHDPNIIRDSAYVTLAVFGALTASVFISKKDFSFMRSGLMMASGAAMMLIVLSLAFGFNLGLVFSIGMVLLAAGYILFQTSQVLAHYDPRNHVAASLALFSSVALMFWYVIRIFMRARE
jgi:FtsH-binding integral membrane protein